jgi:hypothetical protein
LKRGREEVLPASGGIVIEFVSGENPVTTVYTPALIDFSPFQIEVKAVF